MNERPTPETERVKAAYYTNWDDLLNHARKLERERDEARELAEAYKEYAQLLGDEINSMAAVAHFHGWKSSRVEQGKVLREKIKQMEEAK
jgi:NTP pyrophosphatase (non-canonical NTP hydrolase)